jgi:hypothetical protein
MNEQIEKLMREAGMSFTSQTERIVSREEALKFAELIVKECVDYAFYHGDDIEYIMKHFGVEE